MDASTVAANARALRGPGPGFSALNGAGVLVGDVDTGVNCGHGDFDDPAGNTRLLAGRGGSSWRSTKRNRILARFGSPR
jgi:hypothetical protein